MKRFLLYLLFNGLIISLFAQIPSGYYNGTSGLTGSALQLKLHQIIRGHTVRTYTQLWSDFERTDKKTNGKVWDMYSDVPGGTPSYEYTFSTDQCGTYGGEGDCYNREHSFPKSWWGGSTADTMYTDLFHLVPTDGYVNNKRASYPYGEVGSATWTSTNGCKLGPSNYPGYTGTVFEPIDDYKGDFARAYFYMYTRYLSKFDSWAANTDMLDGSGFSSWAQDLLLDWHHQDPVSQKELSRNDSVYAIQGNRNPFIDHPEWVDSIWSGSTSGATAPVFASGYPKAQNVASTAFDIVVNQDKQGTAYYVVLANGAAAPTASQVRNGEDATGTAVASNRKGNISVTSINNDFSSTISSLSAGTDYDVYVVAEDTSSPANLQSAPSLVDVSTNASSAGSMVTIAQQDFDSGAPVWNYSNNPNAYNVSGDVWDIVTSNNDPSGTTGSFWGIRDLNNPNGGGNFDHTLTFDAVDISGYTGVVLSFDYYTKGFDGSDYIKYEVYQGNSGSEVGQGEVSLNKNTNAWTSVSISIPDANNSVYIKIIAYQDGGSDYAGVDNFKVTGTVAANNPEPSNHVSSFMALANGSNIIDLSWNDNDGADVADGYLIIGNTTASSITAPVDGTDQADDLDWSDGSFNVKVAHGIQSYTVTSLSASTTYYFKIYPYSNSGSNIDYKTDGTVPSANATTDAATIMMAWINEFHYDNDGTDTDERVEICVVNASSYNLSDFTVTLYNGNGGGAYSTITLNNFTAGTTYDNVSTYYYDYTANGGSIQNGAPDGIALSYDDGSKAISVLEFISYEGAFTATDGAANGVQSKDVGVSETSTTALGTSIGRSGNNDEWLWEAGNTASWGAENNKADGSKQVLPIELVSFTAYQEHKQVILQWQTATETNNEYFTVERSMDAAQFEEVGRVLGAGNSNTIQNYEFIDNTAPESGIRYYRLKQTDYDGAYTYSKIIAVEAAGEKTILLSYRQDNGQLSLNLTSSYPQNLKLKVYDILGKNLLEKNYQLNSGYNSLEASLPVNQNRLLIIHLYTDSYSEVIKLIP